jgi:hypothetical protein
VEDDHRVPVHRRVDLGDGRAIDRPRQVDRLGFGGEKGVQRRKPHRL